MKKLFRDLGSRLKGRSVYPVPLTKHFENKGVINKKTISIRVINFVLMCGERDHRKLFSQRYTQINFHVLYAICSEFF